MFTPIRSISLSKLRKLEHKGLVEGVISILKAYDLETLRLQNSMEVLLQLRPQLVKLEDKFGPPPLTNEIKLIDERRLTVAGLISSHLQLLERANNKHQRISNGGLFAIILWLMFYETDKVDVLRKKGFSKDGKHSQPQVVFGLLVSKEGYPLSYSIFNGSQYEGRTMLQIVKDFVSRFGIADFVIIADSGLINKSNISLLESGEYKYIIGVRIKNETETIKQWILSLQKCDWEFHKRKKDKLRLIVGYSEKRAKKPLAKQYWYPLSTN